MTSPLASRLARPDTDDRPDPYRDIRRLIHDQAPAIRSALPGHLDPERFARIVLTEVRTNPRLLDCDGMSLLGAVMLAAQLGLEVGPLGHCYLVPRCNKGRWEAQFQLGYKGMIELAYRSDRVASIEAHAVHEADSFEFVYGLSERLEHRPSLDDDRGDLVAVWALARFTNGGHAWLVLSRAEVEARRDRSAASSSGPWTTDFAAMARKTAVRALEPFLPLTADAARAVATDGAVVEAISGDLVDTVASEPPAAVDTTAVDDTPEPPADPPADGGLTHELIDTLSIKACRPYLQEAGLPISGSRSEMRRRLHDYLDGGGEPDGFEEITGWVESLGAEELARQLHGRDIEASGDEVRDRAALADAVLKDEAGQ